MLTVEPFEPSPADFGRMADFGDRLVFQTSEWMRFLVASQGASPAYARVVHPSGAVGYFTGIVVRRFGVRILGSPLPGSTTDYMGFNLPPEIDRLEALRALVPFAQRELGCLHLELRDRFLSVEQAAGLPQVLKARVEPFTLLSIDVASDEDSLFASMKGSVRTSVRKAIREGVTIEEASDAGFADDYMAQLNEVFAKQGLVPTYRADRVRLLIEHLLPSGKLLLLRALARDGRCVATGIFPGYRDTAYFWGGASLQSDQILQPNELLMWHAIRWWKSRGVRMLELGGGGAYKMKYRPVQGWVPGVTVSRFPVLQQARDVARAVYGARQRTGRLVQQALRRRAWSE